MTTQLVLIETPADWHLDDATRAIGRRGLAEARSALQAGGRRAAARELAARNAPAPTEQADAA
jgi:hypothetical protein